MSTRKIIPQLETLKACETALTWVKKTPGTGAQLWAKCPEPSWLFWLAGKRLDNHKGIVLAACACARTALAYVPKGEDRPRLAIEAAEGYVAGTVTKEQLLVARAAAYTAAYAYAAHAADAAADAAASDAAADAARAAARAADAAYAADAYAAAYAADAAAAAAADAAAYAYAAAAAAVCAAADAYAAAYNAAERKHKLLCCGIIRKHLKWADVRKALEGEA